MNRLFSFVISVLLVLITIPILAQTSVDVNCGDIIEAELTAQSRTHSYKLQISAGTELDIFVTPIGSSLNPYIALIDPGDNIITQVNSSLDGELETISGFVVSSSNPEIVIIGISPGNNLASFDTSHIRMGHFYLGKTLGLYQLAIGCKDRQGNVINPGDTLVVEETSTPSDRAIICTGLCFPGIDAVDFSAGIEIPIQAGQAQTAPVGGDLVTLYTYDATAGSSATLSIKRVSGDISAGVAVIHKDSNDIVFIGGMPYTDSLSANLIFPADGAYVIGLFQLRTDTRPETAGAVEVLIES